MSKLCPIKNEKVLYLDCLECEDKICKEKERKSIMPIKKHPNYKPEDDNRFYNYRKKELKDEKILNTLSEIIERYSDGDIDIRDELREIADAIDLYESDCEKYGGAL